MKILLNKIYKSVLNNRLKRIDSATSNPFLNQDLLLRKLIKENRSTIFGVEHQFAKIHSYEDFQRLVPIQDYESLKPYFERTLKGEQGVFYFQKIQRFAKSSGTTDKSKLIPISEDALYNCHFKGGKDMLALYFKNNPQSKLFTGKNLVISGSFDTLTKPIIGDVSAHIVSKLPSWVKYFRSPNIQNAQLKNWEEKLNKITLQVVFENITALSGVPSWMKLVLRKCLDYKNEDCIDKIWPNLEVFFHGGIDFKPLKKGFETLIGRPMHYMELYNASEGFFAIQNDLNQKDLLLMMDYGVYYEFIPIDSSLQNQNQIVNLKEVKINQKYSLVITTNAGLWRYQIGDIIEFTNLNPHKIIICGRTKQFINMFGEELMVHNVDLAIEYATKKSNSIVSNYTIAPIHNEDSTGFHRWFIEFENAPNQIQLFENLIDEKLKENNSDYESKRQGDILLKKPQFVYLKSGTYYKWLKLKNKLGGQYKVPKMSPNIAFQEELLQLNEAS